MSDDWNELLDHGLVKSASYIIRKIGGTYEAIDGNTGKIYTSGADAATVINAAITSNPLSDVYLSAGTYDLSAKISIPTNARLRLRGAGIGTTTLNATSLTMDIIQIGDGATAPDEEMAVTISDLTITSGINKTNGSGILIDKVLYVIIERIKLFNQFIGIQISGASHQIRIVDTSVINVTDATGTGIWLDADGGSDHFFRNVYITGHNNNPAYGLKITNTGGAWFTDMDILFCNEGVEVTPTVGDSVSWLWFNGVSADNSITNNWYFYASGGGICQGISLVNCWGSTGRYGLVISNAWGVVINSGRFLTNNRAGIALYGGEDIKISHCLISGNSTETANTYDGIYIDPNLGHFEITNNKIGFSLFVPLDRQKYGIEVSAGIADYYTIMGNDLTNNNTAGLIDGGTGTHKIVTDNIPYIWKNSGIATITAAATSIAVNHLCNFTPSALDISVVLTNLPTNDVGDVYVDTFGAAQFTIHCRNVPGVSTAIFNWAVRKTP